MSNSEFTKKKFYCDIEITSRREKPSTRLHFSKIGLINASEYFRCMLSGAWSESNGVIELDQRIPVIQVILQYIAGKPIAYYDITNAGYQELLDAASQYLLDGLINECDKIISKHICEMNPVTTINNSDTLPLTKKKLNYIILNGIGGHSLYYVNKINCCGNVLDLDYVKYVALCNMMTDVVLVYKVIMVKKDTRHATCFLNRAIEYYSTTGVSESDVRKMIRSASLLIKEIDRDLYMSVVEMLLIGD